MDIQTALHAGYKSSEPSKRKKKLLQIIDMYEFGRGIPKSRIVVKLQTEIRR